MVQLPEKNMKIIQTNVQKNIFFLVARKMSKVIVNCDTKFDYIKMFSKLHLYFFTRVAGAALFVQQNKSAGYLSRKKKNSLIADFSLISIEQNQILVQQRLLLQKKRNVH